MTVKELITILEAMPMDAEVFFFDTWWDSEGWGEYADEPQWNRVDVVECDIEENMIKLY